MAKEKQIVKKGKEGSTGPIKKSPMKVKEGKSPAAAPYTRPAGQQMPSRPSNAPIEKLSSKERKLAKRDKFAVLKKNFNIIQDASALYELLRPKNATKEERQQLVNQIIEKVHGKVTELAGHHTASRIIQFCAKYGTEKQRMSIMAEVRAAMVELSKGKHGHHLVQKLIAISKRDEVPGLVSQFKGHVAELLRHPRGADVLVDLYDVASTTQRNAMCAEFYGKEYVLFDGVDALSGQLTGLKQLLDGANTAKKRSVFQHMTRALQPVMEKAILHPPMVHRLIREFLECAPSMSVEDAVDTLTQAGTDVLKMVHTHDGAAAACMLIAYGSAKDRKRMIKAMKGHVSVMASNEWGHAVLCTALEVVDDTALVIKTVISELKAMLTEAVEDQYAHRVLLQLLAPSSRRYLPQAITEMMHPRTRTVVGGSGKMVTGLDGDEDEVDVLKLNGDDDGDDEELFASTSEKKAAEKDGKKGSKKGSSETAAAAAESGKSGKRKAAGADEEDTEEAAAASTGPRTLGLSKKDSAMRRKELLGTGPSSFGASLAALVAEQTGLLIRSPHGCDLIVEVARGGDGGLFAEICPEGVQRVQEALTEIVGRGRDEVEAVVADEGQAGPAREMEHVIVHYYASRALRRLILSSAEEGASACSVSCAEQLWGVVKGRCGDWYGGHGDKVLASLVRCGSASVRAEAAKEMKPLLKGGKDVQAWAEALVTPHAKVVKESKKPAAAAGGTKSPAGQTLGKAAMTPGKTTSTPGKAAATPGKAAGTLSKTPQGGPKGAKGSTSAVKKSPGGKAQGPSASVKKPRKV